MSELFAKLKQAEMITDDKRASFEKAKQLKEDGNLLYSKEKNFKSAIRKYHESLMHLNTCRQLFSQSGKNADKKDGVDYSGFPQDIAEFYQECDQLRNFVKLNIAACMLAQEDCKEDYYMGAVKHCNEVLQMEPKNPKAWYRKGVGLYMAKNYHSALDVLKVVDKLFQGKDEKIRAKIVVCESKMNEGERQLKEKLSKAFGSDEKRGCQAEPACCELEASTSQTSTTDCPFSNAG